MKCKFQLSVKAGVDGESLQGCPLKASQNTSIKEKESEKQWLCVLPWVSASRCLRTQRVFSDRRKVHCGADNYRWAVRLFEPPGFSSDAADTPRRLLCKALSSTFFVMIQWLKIKFCAHVGQICALLLAEKGMILRKWLSMDRKSAIADATRKAAKAVRGLSPALFFEIHPSSM